MSTTTNLDKLKINYLTQQQYDSAVENEQINENELYFTPGQDQDFSIDTIEDLIDEKIPTNVSDFTNDAGYLTSHQSIKTVQGSSLLGSGNVDVHNAVAVTISAADWNATTTCTKSVTGVTTSNNVVVAPEPTSIDDYIDAGVRCTAQGSGTLTFTCNSTPSSSMVVNVLIYS